jgi:hypothetical protein
MLEQDNVCDLIIKAIRQNQHMLLIPKSLIISLVLGRLAEKNVCKTKDNEFLFDIRMSPTAAELEIQDTLGLHQSMNTFTGHHEKSP